MAKAPQLAKRFAPYLSQAQTEAEVRYGAQEAALRSILGQTTHDFQQQVGAQDAANRSYQGALQGASSGLSKVYSDAGLTPTLLASLAGTPTGARIAGELASGQGAIQQQQLGAQAGQAYQVQHLGDLYKQDVGKIGDQATSLATEKGQFTQSLLDQLIGTDRSARHAANVEVAKQKFQADQADQGRTQQERDALIGAGLNPDSGSPLPARATNPKPKAKPQATPGAQTTAETAFSRALAGAKAGISHGTAPEDVLSTLTNGIPGSKGQPVFEKHTDKNTGKVTWQKKIDPKTGLAVTTGDSPEVKAVDQDIAQAAVEMASKGYVSTSTIQHLHRLGYTVRDFPGLVTQFQARRAPSSPYGQSAPSPLGPK
jgi:hypothetical protein